jgi:transcriptional regulator with XRE-family HTH domain
MSIEQLAVTAGLGRSTVFLAERAPQLMSERTAQAVAAALGVPVDELRPAAAPDPKAVFGPPGAEGD